MQIPADLDRHRRDTQVGAILEGPVPLKVEQRPLKAGEAHGEGRQEVIGLAVVRVGVYVNRCPPRRPQYASGGMGGQINIAVDVGGLVVSPVDARGFLERH